MREATSSVLNMFFFFFLFLHFSKYLFINKLLPVASFSHKYMNNIMEKISPNQPSEINFGKGNEKLLL